jgi:hypothetical protein
MAAFREHGAANCRRTTATSRARQPAPRSHQADQQQEIARREKANARADRRPSREKSVQDKRLADKQQQHEDGPDAEHGMHPPEFGVGETRPQVELLDHVETAQADHDHGGAGNPDKAAFHGMEGSQLVRAQCAALHGRQDHDGGHEHATDPDHHAEHMQGARKQQFIHGMTPVGWPGQGGA